MLRKPRIGFGARPRRAVDQSEESSREALRRSEARLAEAQRDAHVGSWEFDLATGERTWSDELFRICGLDPAKGPPDSAGNRECYHPDDREQYDANRADLISTGKHKDTDVRILRPTGEVRWCRVTARAVFGEDGQIIRIMGTATDITDRKALEAEREALLANRERLLFEAQQRADRDPLTNLLNHRAFHSHLKAISNVLPTGEANLAVAVIDLDNFKYFNDAYGHAVGDDVLRLIARRLLDRRPADDVIARFGGDEFAILMVGIGHARAASLEARLMADLAGLVYEPGGSSNAIPLTVSVGAALVTGGQDILEALTNADERLHRAKTGGDTDTEAAHVRAAAAGSVQGFSMLDALVTAVDNKDRYTRSHSEDVMTYSLMIADEMSLSEQERRTIAVAALLHDVGKIGVPDAILRKPGQLTAEEFEAVKQHPQMGAIMVTCVAGLEDTIDAIRHHHERWDGGGYPFGLKGEETPFIARLMAVSDAFSAMTTDRPYHKGMDSQQALLILEEGAGAQWDPQCVSAFLAAQKSKPL